MFFVRLKNGVSVEHVTHCSAGDGDGEQKAMDVVE